MHTERSGDLAFAGMKVRVEKTGDSKFFHGWRVVSAFMAKVWARNILRGEINMSLSMT